MPIIKSAQKRVKTAKKASVRNAKTKRTLKEAVKAFQASLKGDKKAGDELKKAQSAIDTAVKKGIIHKNKAARQKSQLAKAAKVSGVKPKASTKAAPKKPATKKPAAKKAPTKKTSKKS